MNKNAVMEILNTVGAMITDSHFVYTSGKHGSAYVNKDALYPHTEQVRRLCAAMAEPFVGKLINTVAGPTIGGVILAQWVAHSLTEREGRPIAACFAEERTAADGAKSRHFGRGYDRWIRNQKILIVEDVLTTGGSVQQVVAAVRACGGTPVAIAALCNRGGVQAGEVGGVPITALLDLPFAAWDPHDCPLCKQGIPINTIVGKGQNNLSP